MLPPWGLDRSDAREGEDGRYEYHRTGRGVHVFVLDTGLYAAHEDFERVGKVRTLPLYHLSLNICLTLSLSHRAFPPSLDARGTIATVTARTWRALWREAGMEWPKRRRCIR
jgi:hypothetical protein